MHASGLEIEVKFLVSDHRPIRRRAVTAGGHRISPRVHEVNLRFDDRRGRLTRAGIVLRLRRDRRSLLTVKRRLRDGIRSEARRRQEIEVEVDNLEAAQAILDALGYRPCFRYEKYRETYSLGAVEVALDELPFGRFVELEGPNDRALRHAARLLSLDWRARYTGSYLALYERVRRAHRLKARDLTFASVADIQVDAGDLGLRIAG